MSRNSSPSRYSRFTLTAALLAASLAVSTSCLEEDEVSPALKEAAAILESLGAPGTSIPGDEFRTDEYVAAIGILKSVSTSGSDTQNASAALMIARAQVGLAETTTRELAQAHEALYELIAQARSEHSEWARLNSLADTEDSFDPAPEQARINTKIQERDESIMQERIASDAVKVRVAELEQLAAQASASAGELRIEEDSIRSEALKLPADEALPLHKQAAKVRRQADAFEVTSEQHLAQADTVRPEIRDHELEIDRLTQQRDLFVTSSQAITAKADQGHAEAESLRVQASAAGQRLVGILAEIEGQRTGVAAQALSAATGALETAASSAGRARSADRKGERLATGEIQQTLGGMLANHASTLEFSSSVLTQIAESLTPLPNQASIQAAASAMHTDAAASKAAALAAFNSARDAFDSVSLRGEASDRIDTVLIGINEAIEALGGPAADAGEENLEDNTMLDSVDDEAVNSDGDDDGDNGTD